MAKTNRDDSRDEAPATALPGRVLLVDDQHDLHTAYDESGEMLMHLQATVDYDHFARALSIGPETMVMDFRPEQPMHQRYAVSHGFLSESAGKQAVAISRIVNAFFHWEFNSAEMLVAGDEVYPIDYANACPDVAVTSLHYYFPWAISALVKWSTYCLVTGRRPNVDLVMTKYFEVADSDRTYDEKLEAYLALADEHFETERYHAWCAEHLVESLHLDLKAQGFDVPVSGKTVEGSPILRVTFEPGTGVTNPITQ